MVETKGIKISGVLLSLIFVYNKINIKLIIFQNCGYNIKVKVTQRKNVFVETQSIIDALLCNVKLHVQVFTV